MIEPIERAALTSVSRGCGFAGFAIMLLMVGMAPFLAFSFKLGGVLALILCLFLWFKAAQAPTRPYRRTETWIILDQADRPMAGVAQQVIGTTLRSVYLTFAQHSAAVAGILLIISLLLTPMQPQMTDPMVGRSILPG